jgi:hypothetical protein
MFNPSMPTAIAPSSSPGRTIDTQKAGEISKPTPMPPLALGEKLNVLVLSDSHNRKTLLQIKNFTLLAETPLPLQSGETLTVHVDQLHPTIVLRTISAEEPGISRANEFLKFYRSNPGALKEMIASLKALFSEGTPNPLPQFLSTGEVQNIHKILNKLIISENNVAGPLFLKDYITALGLTGERRLMKALSDPAILKEKQSGATLKEILLKLSAELTAVQTAPGDNEPDGCRIRQFTDLADHAATVIESLQIVNVLAQEQDGLFMLQIPVQFPDGIRMQELFIETDREKGEQDAEKQCRILLFLDMDALGEFAVDMGLKEGTLHCTFKCPDREVFDFMQPLLPALGQALSGIDYAVGVIQCVLDRNIGSWKQDFLQDHSLFTRNSIDVSI